MPINGLYEPENMRRVKLAQVAVIVLSVAVGGYIAVSTFLSMHEVWSAQQSLGAAKTESAELSRGVARQIKAEARLSPPETGGGDAFAVRFSQWARPRAIVIDSFTPEGAPIPSEIASGDAKLGSWNANKVRIKGDGDYWQVMSLLHEFEVTRMPVKIESFVLQSSQQAGRGTITFDLLLTVYEKATPQTGPAAPQTAGTGAGSGAGEAGQTSAAG
jgi:hypothetical protein